MLLSLHIGFSFVRIAVACAILERISGFEPSSETIAPRYLNHSHTLIVAVMFGNTFTFFTGNLPYRTKGVIENFRIAEMRNKIVHKGHFLDVV